MGGDEARAIVEEVWTVIDEFRDMSPVEFEQWARSSVLVRFMTPFLDRSLLENEIPGDR
jgi:hypothetical protein